MKRILALACLALCFTAIRVSSPTISVLIGLQSPCQPSRTSQSVDNTPGLLDYVRFSSGMQIFVGLIHLP